MKPRYNDLDKYPHGYRSAVSTNVKLTFARVRAAEKAKLLRAQGIQAEAKIKVRELKKAAR